MVQKSKRKFICYQIREIREMTFVKHLKVFDKYEKFQDLSFQAIGIYGFMIDRLSYFEQRGELLRDKDDRPFILMSEEEMAKFARCSIRQIARIKKELMALDLIKQRRLSWNNIKRPDGMKIQFDKQPNAIYVGHIQISPFDKEVTNEFEIDGMKTESKLKANGEIKKQKQEAVLNMLISPSKNGQTVQPRLSANLADKSIAQGRLPANLADKGKMEETVSPRLPANLADRVKPLGDSLSANLADITNHYNLNDTIKDTINDTSKDDPTNFSSVSDQELLKKYFNQKFLTDKTIETLGLFGDLSEAKKYIDIIYQTKKQVENYRQKANKNLEIETLSPFKIDGETFARNLEDEVGKFILQMKLKNSSENPIANPQAYFRKVMSTFWENCMLNQDFYGARLYTDEWEYRDILFEVGNFSSKTDRYDFIYGEERPYFLGQPFDKSIISGIPTRRK